MRLNYKNLGLSAVSIIVALVLIELSMQVLALLSPDIDYILSRKQERVIPDEQLGHRLQPLFQEHDRKGFRNEFVPDEVCVVAMGDSQTYGHKVKPDEAWPKQLGIIGNIHVYNMGVSGYGPVHNYLQWEEAKNLNPNIIIQAFYSGNDLYDCYQMVYQRGYLQRLRSNDDNILRAITAAGTDFDVGPKTVAFARQEKHGEVRALFAEHSKIYGVLRAAKRAYLYNYGVTRKDPYFATDWKLVTELAKKNKGFWIYDAGDIRTVFTTNVRLSAGNLNDIRIAEGHRILLEVLKLMHKEAQAVNLEFIVLLLPTKELVFREHVYGNTKEIPTSYAGLTENELLVWQETKRFLGHHQIYFVDALPALREAVKEGNQPYPISANSHKNPVGHRIVAELVLSKLEEDFKPVLENCRNSLH